MTYTIKSILGDTMHSGDAKTFAEFVEHNKANLTWANLTWANLCGADLNGANLSGVDLNGANLSRANLTWANLRGANLSGANLSEANLRGSDLGGANLTWANLTWADLRWANLNGANLSRADLGGAKTDKRYISLSCIGSAKRMTTYCFDDDIVWCGCFTGTLAEFEARIETTHANNPQWLKEYRAAVAFIKSLKE